MNYFILFLISLVVFFAVDFVWLTKVAPKLYQQHIGHLMAKQFKGIAALLFYLLFMGGFLYFVIVPGLGSSTIEVTLMNAIVYGAVTYGTYDLTNWATLKEWPGKLVLIDMIWGIFLTSSSAVLVFLLAHLWGITL